MMIIYDIVVKRTTNVAVACMCVTAGISLFVRASDQMHFWAGVFSLGAALAYTSAFTANHFLVGRKDGLYGSRWLGPHMVLWTAITIIHSAQVAF